MVGAGAMVCGVGHDIGMSWFGGGFCRRWAILGYKGRAIELGSGKGYDIAMRCRGIARA